MSISPGRAVTSALLLAALCSACAVRPPAPPSAAAHPFILTFWCAPPLALLDDARLAEIAAAGFTTVGAPCEGDLDVDANHRLLARAAAHGLRVWVADHRLYHAAAGAPDGAALAAAVAGDFRDAPALDGYVVADEPTVARFPAVASTVAALRAADPTRLAYVNLLPDYVAPPLLGADSYADYLERFAGQVQPALLSVDYYPFGETRDRSTFFANLAALRETALRHELPFLWILLAMPHGPYRDPTAAEIAWQAWHAVAYGARGISYFAYWTPPPADWQFRDGLITRGLPTDHYFAAQRLNAQLRTVGAALAGWRSLALADSRGTVGAPLPIGPLAAVDGGDITIGLFGDGSGALTALLVNRDYRQPTTLTLHVRPGRGAPLALGPDGRWHPAPAPQWTLPPGGAQLLRWPAP